MLSTFFALFFQISLFPFIITLDSPCPDLFQYLNYSSFDRRWFGELTIPFETDLNNIRILLTFDAKPKYLGTLHGSIHSINKKTYSIFDLEEELKAQVPTKFQFFVVHALSELPPELISIQLNSKEVCTKVLSSSFNQTHPSSPILPILASSFAPMPKYAKIYNLDGFSFLVEYKNEAEVAKCYDVIVYEDKFHEVYNKRFGILTMLSAKSTDESEGVWMRLVFDAAVIKLSSSYGNVTKIDDRAYEIKNFNDQLIKDQLKRVQFVLQYHYYLPAPKLISFHHAGTQVCSAYFLENLDKMYFKNNYDEATISTTTSPDQVDTTTEIQSFTSQVPDSSEDEFFSSDIYQILKPQNNITKPSGNDISCGTVAIRPAPLITYGELTYEGEFPWHVALYYVKGVDLNYICGASLISKSFVITAAHCATKPRKSTSVNKENLIAYLGKHYFHINSSTTIQVKFISEIIIHPQYNANNFSNDIALLKLAHPAEYNDYVRPVCLWQDSVNLNEVLNKPGNVVGWGFDQTGNISKQLMQAFMPVVSLDTCLFSFREFFSKFLTHNSYCAGFKNGTSVCNGDSGGGMVFPKSNSNPKFPIWQLRGLVSLSATLQGNGFKCDPSNYVIFTDIAKYLDWIQNIIK